LSCEYLSEFSKKFETALLVLSKAWGKLIHEKNRSKKSRDTIPLMSASKAKKKFFFFLYINLEIKPILPVGNSSIFISSDVWRRRIPVFLFYDGLKIFRWSWEALFKLALV
jgi:hypothetical protein